MRTDKRDSLDNKAHGISTNHSLSRKCISNSCIIIDLEKMRRKRLTHFTRDGQFNLQSRIMFNIVLLIVDEITIAFRVWPS
jgi:hypothetical protein